MVFHDFENSIRIDLRLNDRFVDNKYFDYRHRKLDNSRWPKIQFKFFLSGLRMNLLRIYKEDLKEKLL